MSTPFTGLINKPLEQMFLFCLAREETQVYNVIKVCTIIFHTISDFSRQANSTPVQKRQTGFLKTAPCARVSAGLTGQRTSLASAAQAIFQLLQAIAFIMARSLCSLAQKAQAQYFLETATSAASSARTIRFHSLSSH